MRATGATAAPVRAPPPAITLTDAALTHLKRLRDDSGSDQLLLRMGVKSGGCSGAASGPRGSAASLLFASRRASSALLSGSGSGWLLLRAGAMSVQSSGRGPESCSRFFVCLCLMTALTAHPNWLAPWL